MQQQKSVAKIIKKKQLKKTYSWPRLDNQNTMEFLPILQKYKALKTSSWHRLDNQNTMEFLISIQKYNTLLSQKNMLFLSIETNK